MDKIQRWEKPRFLASIQLQKLILFQSSPNKCLLYCLSFFRCIKFSRFLAVFFRLKVYSLSRNPLIAKKAFATIQQQQPFPDRPFAISIIPDFAFTPPVRFVAGTNSWDNLYVNNHVTLFQQLFETYFTLEITSRGAEIKSWEQYKS